MLRAAPLLWARHDPSTQSRDELTRFGVFILETAEQRLDVPPGS